MAKPVLFYGCHTLEIIKAMGKLHLMKRNKLRPFLSGDFPLFSSIFEIPSTSFLSFI